MGSRYSSLGVGRVHGDERARSWVSHAKAEEWKMEQGGIEPGKIVLGMRAGFAPLTQSVDRQYFD